MEKRGMQRAALAFILVGLTAVMVDSASGQIWVLGNLALGLVPCYLLHLTVRFER